MRGGTFDSLCATSLRVTSLCATPLCVMARNEANQISSFQFSVFSWQIAVVQLSVVALRHGEERSQPGMRLDGKTTHWIASSFLLAMTRSGDKARGDDARRHLCPALRHPALRHLALRHPASRHGEARSHPGMVLNEKTTPWIASSFLLAMTRSGDKGRSQPGIRLPKIIITFAND